MDSFTTLEVRLMVQFMVQKLPVLCVIGNRNKSQCEKNRWDIRENNVTVEGEEIQDTRLFCMTF